MKSVCSIAGCSGHGMQQQQTAVSRDEIPFRHFSECDHQGTAGIQRTVSGNRSRSVVFISDKVNTE